MADLRHEKLARVMLGHSMRIAPGEAFTITADISALPLVKELLRQTRVLGAFCIVDWTHQEITRMVLEQYTADDPATIAFLTDETEIGKRRYQNKVGNISIRAYPNDQELRSVPPAVKQTAARLREPLQKMMVNERRWVLFEYPTAGQAQNAEMSLDAYSDFVFSVATVDYAAMAESLKPLQALMQRTDKVRLTGRDTDLSFSIRGLPAIPCAGEFNLPDGECFSAPVRDSVEGVITFNAPSMFWGHTFTNVRLEFAGGKIVKAGSDQGDEMLNRIFDTDEGARYVGEFSLGFNPLIREPFKNTLFDEKITGSFHFTPGSSYRECDNGNHSAIHWDLVHIQRPEYGGGEVWFDDVCVRRDGLFTLPELQGLNP